MSAATDELIITAAADEPDAASAEGRAAYVSIPVPPALARMWPHDGRTAAGDDSAPHVTLLYMPEVTAAKAVELARRFSAVAAAHGPIPVELAPGVESFRDGRAGGRHVISKGFHPKTAEDLRALHTALLKEARAAGVEVSAFSGDKYNPHTTLAYSDSPEWRGRVPHGGWTATAALLHHEGADDLVLPFGAAPRAAAALRTAGRARYQAGEAAGEFPIEHAAVGDRARFVADFEKLADEDDADNVGASAGTVLRDADGVVEAVYPDGPSMLVRTTLRRGDGSMVPDVIEVPPEAVTLVLAAGDPRAKSAARDLAQRVFMLAGFVSAPTVRVAVLHAALTRKVAAASHRLAVEALAEVAAAGRDTWARWAFVAPKAFGVVPLRRVAGLQPRTVELVRWAFGALAESGRRARGRPLDPARRDDALWALNAIKADFEHGLPEHVYADLEEMLEIRSSMAQLDHAIADVESVPEDQWAASGSVESDVDRAAAVLDQHYKAISLRTKARMSFEKLKRGKPTNGDGVQALLDAEREYGMAELWVRAIEDWIAELPPEAVAEARRRREPTIDPSKLEERGPIPETRAREVEDDEGLPGTPMGHHPPPSEVAAPPVVEPAPAPAAPPSAPEAPAAEPAGPPTLIWGYSGFMDRMEWRYDRVKAEVGLRVRNKNSDEVGVVTELPDPYTVAVKVDGGRAAYWSAAETAVDKSVKTPLPMATKNELKVWRDGLKGTRAANVTTTMAILASGLEDSDAGSLRWIRTAQHTGLVNWPGETLALVAEVEASHRRMVHPGAPEPLAAAAGLALPLPLRLDASTRRAQEAAVWMLQPVQPGATKLPVARELIHRAIIEGDVAHGPGGVDYAYVAGQNEVTAEDGRKAAVYAEQGQAYQAFLDTMLRPWLREHAEDIAALPTEQLDKMYRGGVG